VTLSLKPIPSNAPTLTVNPYTNPKFIFLLRFLETLRLKKVKKVINSIVKKKLKKEKVKG
jgi:hypothetical protein